MLIFSESRAALSCRTGNARPGELNTVSDCFMFVSAKCYYILNWKSNDL